MQNATVQVYYEYELYNELQAESEIELSKHGFSPSEIQTLKSKTYLDLLKERSSLSENELKNYGYNEEQIAVLKKENPTNAELRGLVTYNKFTIKTLIEKLDYHPNGYTYSTIYVEWNWTTVPFSLFTDDFAIAWTNGMVFMNYNENNKSRYTLYRRNSVTGESAMTTKGLYAKDYVQLGAAVQIPEFPLEQVPSVNSKPMGPTNSKNHTYKGAARVALKKYGVVSNMEAQGAYAHYSIGVSSISLALKGISISFTKNPYATYRANDYRTVSYL